MRIFTLPNSLSMSRVALAPPALWSLVYGWAALTVVLYCIAIVSDLLDGLDFWSVCAIQAEPGAEVGVELGPEPDSQDLVGVTRCSGFAALVD